MRVKTIKYNFGRRVDLGSHNGVSASLTVEVELEQGDDFDEVLAGTRLTVQENVFNAVGVYVPDWEAIAEETFCGLPVHLVDSNSIEPETFVNDAMAEQINESAGSDPHLKVEDSESLEVEDAD